MKDIYKVKVNGLPAQLELFKFSGGETQVKFENPSTSQKDNLVEIFALIREGDIMPLALIKDAIERTMCNSEFVLQLPYLPYARQDRVMNTGESLAVKVFSEALNNLNFKEVVITDCHSDVGLALVNNVKNITDHSKIAGKMYDALVSPDAGALKKSYKYAKQLSIPEVIRADKTRDVTNGNITGTTFYGDVTGKKVIIVDDLADGSYTFICLAKVLKEAGAKQVDLFVHHGIFSKGKQVLDGYVDNIYAAYDWAEM